jgi:thiol-disulfide isomerase/thioredoxin
MKAVRPSRIAFIAVAALALGGFLLYGLANQPDESDQPLGLNRSFSAFEAPALQGETLDGQTFDLTSLRGKPVVVNFWASWCGPCNQEAPELVRFANENRAHVVGVNIDDKGSKARSFARTHGLEFPLVPKDINTLFDYKGPGLPFTVIVDADGRVVDTHAGVVTAKLLDSKIDDLRA